MPDTCQYCGGDLETFEEVKDKKGRTYLKAVCPNPKCGKTTKRWPKKKPLPDDSEDTPEDIPADTPETPLPDDSEDEEVITSKEQELITDEKKVDEKEKKPDQWKDIALLILTGLLIVFVVISIWLATKDKEAEHGKEKN